jgi:acetate kinase
MSREERVLCLNAGSSSLKYALFSVSERREERLGAGNVEDIGSKDGPESHERAFAVALERLSREASPEPTVAAHRVVHGGTEFSEPTLIDRAATSRLRTLVKLAPLHLPASLSGIEAVTGRYPGLPQVACFDTAFHAGLPERARRFPLPDSLYRAGLRRYGFHGLSCESALAKLGEPAPGRVVVAHLGNGASVTAVRDGRSIDTSMGFTPSSGVMMGTRPGDLDPGLLLHLLREERLDAARLEQLVNHEAGLFGVGGASDVRVLLRERARNPSARLALEMFVYSVQKVVAGFVAALGGLDVLVFTGGIGEHSSEVRREICAGLAVFGVELDERKNAASAERIEGDASKSAVCVLPAEEERVMARHAARVLVAHRS